MSTKKLFSLKHPSGRAGHRVKVMSGLYLCHGEAMLLDPALVKGLPHVVEVEADGSAVGDKYSRPDPDIDICIPDDNGALAEAATAIREREAKPGKKKSGKRSIKAKDKKEVKAAIAAAAKAEKAAAE